MSITDQSSSAPNRSPRGKTWLIIGDMRYGTKRTDDILNKRAAYILAHPELYSIHSKAKRIRMEYYDYKFVMHTSDIVMALDVSMRQAQRLLQMARKRLKKSRQEYVSVSEFCYLNKFNEREIRIRIVPKPADGEKIYKRYRDKTNW